MILGLINIGSTTAFNALISLTLHGQYVTYGLPTIPILARRISRSKNIPYGPWELGRLGIPVNIVTIALSFITTAFNLLPPYFPVTISNFNYAPVVFGAAPILCTLLWFVRRKQHYAGPIRQVMENGDLRSALLNHEVGAMHQVHDREAV